MKLHVLNTEKELGQVAADLISEALIAAIKENGEANYLVSTGSSQFTTFEALIANKDIDWTKVTMYHLDEYVGLPESHIASFRKYLKERFVSKVPLKKAVFVNGEGDIEENLRMLEEELAAHPIDVGAIGIGENGHIAFNDPPALFEKEGAYHVVNLNDTCKKQQVGEGWFATVDDVPKQAISMTCGQIMKCKVIVCAVPGERKAEAIYNTLRIDTPDPMVPATLLKLHPAVHVVVDAGSASKCDEALVKKFS
ncbi:MAG: glucosamine-6-phosphate deaminase [Clostridia bacterium]|nr:glucosamine-6-phosphate deaminase [Clostridia bacterium]